MNVQRCELSELPVDQCACRIHKPGQEVDAHATADTANVAGPVVAARYSTRCRNCGDTIRIDDPVRPAKTPMGTRWVHDECAG